MCPSTRLEQQGSHRGLPRNCASRARVTLCFPASSFLPPPPQYDKFHLRGCIDALLVELWRDPACAASLTAAAQAGGGAFAAFVGAVLNDLMYLLKDSLSVSRASRKGWRGQPAVARAACRAGSARVSLARAAAWGRRHEQRG